MLVCGDHFRLDWMTPKQVGAKAVEANVSDIASMGGLPKYALVSIALPEDAEIEMVGELYAGMRKAAAKYGLEIVGGNTTHSRTMTIDLSIIGFVEKDRLTLRSGAKVGDLICTTGDLGKSTAGLELLRARKKGYTQYYKNPKCRLREARKIAEHANSMIDVSDGLASEVGHICKMSGVGAEVYAEKIPISAKTRAAARAVGKNPLNYALHGGEDYELVFTVPKSKLKKIKVACPITVVGRILPKKAGRWLLEGGKTKPLGGGFDHFKT
jgi:thiamine-monophosphate kinase